ncbi:MAG: hypothetical protein IKW08_05895 [Roseburia sp.]|nr:hypothetical protein [Roseburia sp.]
MQYREVFNFMASTIERLEKNTDESFFDTYDAKVWKKVERLKRKLETILPELFMEAKVFLENLLTQDLLQRVEIICDKAFEEKNYDMILTILQKMDIFLEEPVETYRLMFADKRAGNWNGELMEGSKCLNDNFDVCNLQLLPKCACKWSHNSREKTASNTINAYLKNCYYISLDRLGKYKVNHIFLPEQFERASWKHCLRIGMTPLCNMAELDVGYFVENETNYFEIENVQNEKEVKEIALNQLELAKENDVDIMMYPEMLGTKCVLDALCEKLEAFVEDEKEYPGLVLCPTIWKDRKNICVVFDREGDAIAEQEKQHAYSYPKEGNVYIEGIIPNNVINVIHCEGIGRIVILICKDALKREYLHMILAELKATLILIPSFSTGSYDFGEMTQMCRAYDCCALWINTCSVGEPENIKPDRMEIKGTFLRTGKADSRMKNETLEFRNCNREDGSDCKECLYIAELLF